MVKTMFDHYSEPVARPRSPFEQWNMDPRMEDHGPMKSGKFYQRRKGGPLVPTDQANDEWRQNLRKEFGLLDGYSDTFPSRAPNKGLGGDTWFGTRTEMAGLGEPPREVSTQEINAFDRAKVVHGTFPNDSELMNILVEMLSQIETKEAGLPMGTVPPALFVEIINEDTLREGLMSDDSDVVQQIARVFKERYSTKESGGMGLAPVMLAGVAFAAYFLFFR